MGSALVIFESMFGNTQVIAQAVADGPARHLPVDLVEVGAAPAAVGPEWSCWSWAARPMRSG
jgi:hypothetical protein